MSQGQISRAQVTSDGAALTVSCGFYPSRVEVINETSRDKMVWTDSMADGEAIKTVAAGTSTKITSGGITLYTGSDSAAIGFTIGADADVNADTEVLHYYAESGRI